MHHRRCVFTPRVVGRLRRGGIGAAHVQQSILQLPARQHGVAVATEYRNGVAYVSCRDFAARAAFALTRAVTPACAVAHTFLLYCLFIAHSVREVMQVPEDRFRALLRSGAAASDVGASASGEPASASADAAHAGAASPAAVAATMRSRATRQHAPLL